MKQGFILPPFIVIDFETTGFSTTEDEVIEFGGILVGKDWQVKETFSELAFPMRKEISWLNTKLTGISYGLLKEKQADQTYFVMDRFLSFIGDYPLVGHNVSFDIGFIEQALSIRNNGEDIKLSNLRVDTLKLARQEIKGLPSYSLGALAWQLGISSAGAHRALSDVLCAFELYKKLFTLAHKNRL